MRLLIAWLLVCQHFFVFFATSSQIVGLTPYLEVDAKTGTAQHYQTASILCDGPDQVSFSVTSTETGQAYDVVVQCKRPVITAAVGLSSYIPFGTRIFSTPVAFGPTGYNYSTASNAYLTKIHDATMANADQTLVNPPTHPTGRSLLQSNDDTSSPSSTDPAVTSPYDLSELDEFNSWNKIHQVQLAINVLQFLPAALGLYGLRAVTTFAQQGITAIAKQAGTVVAGEASSFAAGAIGGPITLALTLAPLIISVFSDDPVDLLAKDVKILADVVEEIGNLVVQWENKQIQINQEQNTINVDARKTFTAFGQRLDADERAIRDLYNDTHIIQSEVENIVNVVDGKFAYLASSLGTLYQLDENITDYLNKLDQRDAQRINSVWQTIHQLLGTIQELSDGIAAVDQKKWEKRSAVRIFFDSFYELMASYEVGRLAPFMSDIGAAPMSQDQITALRTKSKAIVLSSIEIQGTRYTPTGYKAQATTVALVCDPTFIANKSGIPIGVDVILSYIGPFVGGTTHCYDPSPTQDSWFCNCVLKVNTTVLSYSGLNTVPYPLYPFDYEASNRLLSLVDDPQIYTQFPDCTRETMIEGTCTAEISDDRYFDNLREFEAYMKNDVCRLTWVRDAVHVVSDDMGLYSRVNVSDWVQPFGYNCETNFYNVTGPDAPTNDSYFGFSMYRPLTAAAQLYFPLIQSSIEQQLYGYIGDVKFEESITATFPGLRRIIKAFQITCASVVMRLDQTHIPRLLPVYSVTREEPEFSIDLYINEELVTTHSSAGTNTVVPMVSGESGNITVTTNTALGRIEGDSLIPQQFLWVGTETVYTSDSRTHNVDGSPKLFCDFKHSLLRYNVPARFRPGLNYVQINSGDLPKDIYFGEGMPINLTMWQALNADKFDPTLTESCTSYLVEVDPDTGLCDRPIDDLTMTPRESLVPQNDMCQIRSRFFVTTEMTPTTTQLEFVARSASFIAEVKIPAGQISVVLDYTCPSSVQVTNVGPSTVVIMQGSARSGLLYSICKDGGLDCIVANTPLSLPFTTTYSLGAVEYFLQVWAARTATPTPSTLCYSDNNLRGIRLLNDYKFSFVDGIPHSQQVAQLQIIDQRLYPLYQFLEDAVNNLAAQIRLGQQTDVTGPPFSIIPVFINDSYLRQGTDLSQFINSLNASDSDFQQAMAISYNASVEIKRLLDDMTVRIGRISNLTLEEELITNATQALIDALAAALSKAGDVPNGFSIPGFGSLADALKEALDNLNPKNWLSALSDLLGLPGGILDKLASIIVPIIVIFVCICLCWVLCQLRNMKNAVAAK